jgi:murein DD-endopeptidase MepM/ murein hydrolase activator NlpD/ribosomal protein S25
MADDIPQDQTVTDTTNPTVPPTDQPPVETPPAPSTPEQQPTIPVVPEIPNPEPVASVTPEPQTQPTETKTETPVASETQPEQTPVIPQILDIPAFHYPFSGNFVVTFSFGQQSDNEEIKKKFQEWGIAGHNGLDFGLSAGNEVFACDVGKIIQSGDNGDFGISITIQHSWGQSIYAHLQETKVNEGDEIQVNKIIGLSGSSGAAFGEHLHFAIKPNNPDLNNGYLGFIDPAPYLSLPSQKEESKQEMTETPPAQTPPVQENKPEETKPSEPVPQPEPTINIESEKPTEQQPQVPQVNDEEIQKQVDEKLKTELDARRLKANQARQTKREENLMKIEKLIEEKKQINNNDVCDFLHVSQSTATNYLEDLVKRGTIKTEGKGKATVYHF